MIITHESYRGPYVVCVVFSKNLYLFRVCPVIRRSQRGKLNRDRCLSTIGDGSDVGRRSGKWITERVTKRERHFIYVVKGGRFLFVFVKELRILLSYLL